jgi:hypothetical protein
MGQLLAELLLMKSSPGRGRNYEVSDQPFYNGKPGRTVAGAFPVRGVPLTLSRRHHDSLFFDDNRHHTSSLHTFCDLQ